MSASPGDSGLASLAEWMRYLKEIGVRELRAPACGTAHDPPRLRSPAEPAAQRAGIGSPPPGAPAPPRPDPALPARQNALPMIDALPTAVGDSAAKLAEIRDEMGDCTRCKLHHRRTNIVFGVGSPQARLMFIGEGPGADEDAQGEPFVGRAGKKLDEMIAAIGLRREEVYIANVVKCRPPDNREPEPDEVATCSPFLFAQIEAIRPRVIVTLGAPATRTLLRSKIGITRLRGTWQSYRGIPVMPTFHPAYLLRSYTPENRRRVWEDLRAARARLDEAP